MVDWREHEKRELARYRDGEARLGGTPDDPRQRQLTRLGNAAGGAGLALLMQGRREDARSWFRRAVDRYRESWADAPPESWGRPIGAIKARLLAGDDAQAEAEWALAAGAAQSESPIGRYAAVLALLVLGRDGEALPLADSLRGREDFPVPVAEALAALAARDGIAYRVAVTTVLESFETREAYLEDLPVADTVVVLQALAEPRGAAVALTSPLLPG
jgi:hypothetical protein